jgi:hypothetical protein
VICLGRLPSVNDRRSLRLGDYLTERFPAPPPKRDWSAARYPMYDNDIVGCCTIAAAAHLIHTWSSAAGHDVSLSLDAVLDAYGAVSGYSPQVPGSDRGAAMLDALKHWRKTGIGGRKLGAFVRIDAADRRQFEAAVNLFGGAYIGAQLPRAAERQTFWDVGDTPDFRSGSWGGHTMACTSYDRGGVALVTWGTVKLATWEWMARYADEAYAVIGNEWVIEGRSAPNGFDINRLRADLERVAA